MFSAGHQRKDVWMRRRPRRHTQRHDTILIKGDKFEIRHKLLSFRRLGRGQTLISSGSTLQRRSWEDQPQRSPTHRRGHPQLEDVNPARWRSARRRQRFRLRLPQSALKCSSKKLLERNRRLQSVCVSKFLTKKDAKHQT